jgi:hypothetical protein
MTQHSTSAPALAPAPLPPLPPLPPLLLELGRLLAAHRPAVRQARCFDRVCALVLGHLGTLARQTITQMLLALGLSDTDWSAFYRLFSRPRIEYDALTRCYLRQTLAQMPASEPYVAVLDGVQLPRSSLRMPGSSWLKNPRTPPFKPGIHRAQRFVHLAALVPRWRGYSRALPLRFVPAFPPKAVPGAAEPQTEWQAGGAQLHWLRAELDAAGRPAQPVLALGDGNYDVAELWRRLPARTVLLVRTARNRALYALPPRRSGRGRPPVYGPHALTPAQWLHERGGWQQATVGVRGRDLLLRYRVEGPFLRYEVPEQPVFLLVVRGGRGPGQRRPRPPAFYLVSAVQRAGQWVCPGPADDLLAWAWQRWEVEVSHRGMKTDWGVGQVQCWHPQATVRAVQWQVWSYGLCVLAGHCAWGYAGHPPALRPAGLWWHGPPRWSLATLRRGFQQALAPGTAFSPAWTRTRGNWPEKEAAVHHLVARCAPVPPL